MSKVDDYRLVLQKLRDWDPYLLQHSGLPGPRGNIELGRAAAEEASPERIWVWLEWDHERAPANSPEGSRRQQLSLPEVVAAVAADPQARATTTSCKSVDSPRRRWLRGGKPRRFNLRSPRLTLHRVGALVLGRRYRAEEPIGSCSTSVGEISPLVNSASSSRCDLVRGRRDDRDLVRGRRDDRDLVGWCGDGFPALRSLDLAA